MNYLFPLIFILVLLIGLYVTYSNYNECRENGFSTLYCTTQLLK